MNSFLSMRARVCCIPCWANCLWPAGLPDRTSWHHLSDRIHFGAEPPAHCRIIQPDCHAQALQVISVAFRSTAHTVNETSGSQSGWTRRTKRGFPHCHRKENLSAPRVPDAHPFDVVGWDGYNYPYAFNAEDFEPITGRVHMPPPIHQTFEAQFCGLLLHRGCTITTPSPFRRLTITATSIPMRCSIMWTATS